MRHPSLDKRAAQFMFASPRRAKHVRTSSCAKALARMSYTRGLASFFIVATPPRAAGLIGGLGGTINELFVTDLHAIVRAFAQLGLRPRRKRDLQFRVT